MRLVSDKRISPVKRYELYYRGERSVSRGRHVVTEHIYEAPASIARELMDKGARPDGEVHSPALSNG